MNIEAEFDQLIHNVVTAINDVFENARSNPINLKLEEAEGKPADYYNLFSMKLDDVELNYETRQREKEKLWLKADGTETTEGSKDAVSYIWVWPEPQ